MQIVPAVKAQTKFGELIDQAQREVIAVTRYGRTIAYVVSEHDMRELQAGMLRRRKAGAAFGSYGKKVLTERASDIATPSEEEINALVNELRN
jgi:antitoxin Phd